jgi:murein DD-endopeptidase MepM/ murein hydrolase activator NlpD
MLGLVRIPCPRRLPFLLLALGLSALAAEERPTLSLQPPQARPGDPVLVIVRGLTQAPTGILGERPLRFFPTRSGFQAITGIPVEQPLGPLEAKVTVPDPEGAAALVLVGSLEVVEPGWRERRLSVASQYVQPPPEVEARMEEDRAAFAAAFAQPFSPPLFAEEFTWPRKADITGRYGDLRTFNGEKLSQHFGTDLRGGIGARVQAANAGVVVMTRDNYAAGNTVLLHHGAGLYTAYFHLSKILVKEGEQVKRGQLLGHVGSTGRSTGPHLHWGVKVEDVWVDAQTLMKLKFF